jgi:hypothetical protein
MGHHGYRVTITMVLGHYGLGSRVTMVTGSWVTMSYHHPGLGLQGYRVTHHHGSRVTITRVLNLGSPWSQGLHGHRVTHHPGLGSRVTPQPYLQGHHGLGSHTTRVLPLGAHRHRKPANREPPILYRIFRKRVQSYLI